jgi:hypothetical protein
MFRLRLQYQGAAATSMGQFGMPQYGDGGVAGGGETGGSVAGGDVQFGGGLYLPSFSG